jgi:hypothetical protein
MEAGMSRQYELWDQEYGNCLGSWENEADALAGVRAAVRSFGRAAAEHLALGCEDEFGTFTKLEGAALLARAEEAADRAAS